MNYVHGQIFNYHTVMNINEIRCMGGLSWVAFLQNN